MRPGVSLASVLAIAFVGQLSAAQESQLDARKAASRGAPLDPAAALQYGVALRRAGHVAEAARELRRGSALSSAGRGPTGIMLRYELARTAIDQHDFYGALSICRSLGPPPVSAPQTGTPPVSPLQEAASHACVAEAHLLWRRASEALVETGLALAHGSQSYEAKVAEGLAYELEVKDADAEASWREAIAWKPDAWEAHAWLGRLLVRTLRHDDGIDELRRAMALDPHGPEPAYELARALPSSPESVALLERAVEERPSYVPALLRLADVDLELERLAPAQKAADAVVKLSASEPSAYVVSGRISLIEGKPDLALRAGQKALALVPNSAGAKLLVADAYAAKGEIDPAIENYQAAHWLDSSDATPLVRASMACHAAGRETSARAFGERATHDFPGWAPGWVALGDALVGQGELPQARTAYDAALKSTGPIDAALVRAKLTALR
jgi:tetratricopeptide (TPR) repeat protein